MLKVGVIGGSGYTGVELLRLLSQHPAVQLVAIGARSAAGQRVSTHYPQLTGIQELDFVAPDSTDFMACDLVFFATPNGTAMQQAPKLLEHGVRVIDLAADFRLQDANLWEQYYGMPHTCPELLPEAVYGLPELQRAKIRTAQLVANPGCYPTATLLGLLPLLQHNQVRTDTLIADVKSGVSGAGREPKTAILFSETAENFRAYSVGTHRHQAEICQALATVTEKPIQLTFVPHVVPMVRGIHATLYADLQPNHADIQALFAEYYQSEPFVTVLPPQSTPETAFVRGSNHCHLAVHMLPEQNKVIILSVEDNLVKGAAGQAVQNLNIMFQLDETTGLLSTALWP